MTAPVRPRPQDWCPRCTDGRRPGKRVEWHVASATLKTGNVLAALSFAEALRLAVFFVRIDERRPVHRLSIHRSVR